jgi:hypothetical protein
MSAELLQRLERANTVRSRRADLKRQLKRGERKLATAIADVPWWLRTATAEDMVEAVPYLGEVLGPKLLHRARVLPRTELGRLNVRQRLDLIRELNAWEAR